MPVLELLALRLKPSVSPTSASLLSDLREVRSALGTSSRFYSCIGDPSLILILGFWPSLKAHQDFLSSPSKDSILSAQASQTELLWMVHLEVSSPSALPLDAPVLSIARLRAQGGKEEVIGDFHKQSAPKIREASKWPVFDAWRCDVEEGHSGGELVVITGWTSKEQHIGYMKQDEAKREEDFARVRDTLSSRQVLWVKDMEVAEVPA